MKYLTGSVPLSNRVKQGWGIVRIVVISVFLIKLLFPVMGFAHSVTTKGISYTFISMTKGEFAADLWQSGKNWSGAFEGMKFKNWVK